VISDDESSCSFESSDNDLVDSAAAIKTFLFEAGRRHQRS